MCTDDFLGVIITLVLMIIFMNTLIINPQQEKIEKLGIAICKEQYSLQYDFVDSDNVLHCKNETKQHYDGLSVVTNNVGE